VPVYGLIFGLPSQKKIIDDHCFGICKKIIFGVIKDKKLGLIVPCRIPKEQCPQFDVEMNEPFGEVNGEPIFIRKLKV